MFILRQSIPQSSHLVSQSADTFHNRQFHNQHTQMSGFLFHVKSNGIQLNLPPKKEIYQFPNLTEICFVYEPKGMGWAPFWVGGRIQPPFPCVSYKTTNRVSQCQRVYTWNYAGHLYNPYRDAGPKLCHHSQTSRAQSPLNPFYTWCNMLLTELPHSPVVSIPLPLLSNSPLSFPPLRAQELESIINQES